MCPFRPHCAYLYLQKGTSSMSSHVCNSFFISLYSPWNRRCKENSFEIRKKGDFVFFLIMNTWTTCGVRRTRRHVKSCSSINRTFISSPPTWIPFRKNWKWVSNFKQCVSAWLNGTASSLKCRGHFHFSFLSFVLRFCWREIDCNGSTADAYARHALLTCDFLVKPCDIQIMGSSRLKWVQIHK